MTNREQVDPNTVFTVTVYTIDGSQTEHRLSVPSDADEFSDRIRELVSKIFECMRERSPTLVMENPTAIYRSAHVTKVLPDVAQEYVERAIGFLS